MKNFFIGLLVVAAGTAVYFFVIKKKKDQPVTGINKEWIIGKWKTDLAQQAADSTKPPITYVFQKEGIALRSVSDTVTADTLHYAWKETGELLLKEKATDTTGTLLAVSKLTADSLELKGSDNATILFTKLK